MRCKNQGSDYDDDNVQWTCTAALPSEYKLGSTDVVCEGYDSSSDPYILKGSCGVEYRLVLTESGEEKYGKKGPSFISDSQASNLPATLFWIIFVGVVLWMLYSAFIRNNGNAPRNRVPRGPRRGGGGGGGGNDGIIAIKHLLEWVNNMHHNRR